MKRTLLNADEVKKVLAGDDEVFEKFYFMYLEYAEKICRKYAYKLGVKISEDEKREIAQEVMADLVMIYLEKFNEL